MVTAAAQGRASSSNPPQTRTMRAAGLAQLRVRWGRHWAWEGKLDGCSATRLNRGASLTAARRPKWGEKWESDIS